MNYDEIPEWIKTTTHAPESGDLEKLNFLRGSYVGHALKVADLEQRIEELEEQVELSRAFERERIIQWLEKDNLHNTAKHLRENLPE